MTAEFDQLVVEFERFQAGLENVDERFERLAGLQGELESLRVSAVSPDHAVTVSAGPGGAVTDVRVTEAAMRLTPEQLSATIMTTLRTAVADAARTQAAIVQDHVGAETDVLDQVLEVQAEVTGTPVEELRDQVRGAVPEEEPEVFTEDEPRRAEPRPGPATDSYLNNLSDEED
jgi:DNA-binding protein YbaB